DEDDPGEHDRERQQGRTRRPLPEEEPREEADDDDLEIPENGRQPSPDRLDRVVPEHEVAGEGDASDRRDRHRPSRQRTMSAQFPVRDEHEQRQPEHRPVERPGRGRDRGVDVEDTGERDARGTEQRREAWSPGEPVERPERGAQEYSSPARYLSPESTCAVETRASSPSRRATWRAAVMLAPVDGPDHTPSARATRR